MATTNILPMNVETVALGEVTPHPDNARQGDTARIATSLTANGQYRPLVVQRSTGFILAGNHTHAAAQTLGWPEIAVQYVDVDEAAARRILLADNKTSDEATYDDDLLAALLSEVADDPTGTGYDDDEITTLLDVLDAPTDLPGEDNDDGDEDGAAAPATTPAAPAPAPTPDSDAQDDSPPPAPAPEPTEDDTPAPTPAPAPVAEMILAFNPDDRNEAAQLIAAIRTALGDDVKTADIVLRALRTLTAAVDARHTPDSTITVAELLKNAT